MLDKMLQLPRKKASKNKNQPKSWLVLSYLYVLIITNCVFVITCFAGIELAHEVHRTIPNEILFPGLFLTSLNILFLYNIIKMKKWGVWGYCGVSVLTVVISIFLIHDPILKALCSLSGIGLLFLLLNLGGKKKMWNQMV